MQYLPFINITGETSMRVNEKIKLLRKIKGLSQEKIAAQLSMSPNGYGCIERGETDISLSRLEEIANLFGVNPSDLLQNEEKNIFNIIENCTGESQSNQIFCSVDPDEKKSMAYLKLKHELDKQRILCHAKDTEIELLKEINRLLKIEIDKS